MPNYDYKCTWCGCTFEIFSPISNYKENVSCKYCKHPAFRDYMNVKTFIRYKSIKNEGKGK